jgi:hypothetical protein
MWYQWPCEVPVQSSQIFWAAPTRKLKGVIIGPWRMVSVKLLEKLLENVLCDNVGQTAELCLYCIKWISHVTDLDLTWSEYFEVSVARYSQFSENGINWKFPRRSRSELLSFFCRFSKPVVFRIFFMRKSSQFWAGCKPVLNTKLIYYVLK